MSDSFKSITHGTCALRGRHTSEKYAAECPALGRSPEERLPRFHSGSSVSEQGAATTLRGQSEEPLSSREDPGVSSTVFRDGRAGKSGRPRVPEIVQRQKTRGRARAYRARRRARRAGQA